MGMIDVDVRRARADERPVFENLFQLYTHDFSEHWAGTSRGDVDEDGRFAPHPLDPYWTDPEHIPLLFRVSGRIAGFALLDRTSRANSSLDRNVAEFFILRKYRRAGIGTACAHTMLARFPGRWEIAVAACNKVALQFWRRGVETCPGLLDCSEIAEASSDWNGPVLRFELAA